MARWPWLRQKASAYVLRVQNGVLLQHHVPSGLAQELKDTQAGCSQRGRPSTPGIPWGCCPAGPEGNWGQGRGDCVVWLTAERRGPRVPTPGAAHRLHPAPGAGQGARACRGSTPTMHCAAQLQAPASPGPQLPACTAPLPVHAPASQDHSSQHAPRPWTTAPSVPRAPPIPCTCLPRTPPPSMPCDEGRPGGRPRGACRVP